MKKIIVSALATSLILGSMASVGFADTSGAGFSDISKSYAKDAILDLQAKGILSGTNGAFNPKGDMSRAEYVVMLVKSLKLEVSTTPTISSFTDVSGWAVPYIEAALKAGIITGNGNGTFAPNAVLTREMSVVMLVRSLQSQGKLDGEATLNFKDANDISAWARQAIAIAVKYGLIAGTPDGKFNPKGVTNREMGATMGSNLLEAIETIIKPVVPPVVTPPVVVPPVTTPPVSGGGSSSGGSGGGNSGDNTTPPVAVTLSSIAIKQLPTKLTYTVGEALDLTGLVVTGTYSNSTKAPISITASNVTGFNSSVAIDSQVLTITVGSKSTTYNVKIVAEVPEVVAPAISSVSIASSNANSSYAKTGDTISLTFTTDEEVTKLSNFKINGGNTVSFSSTLTGKVYRNVATYVIDDSDLEGLMNFQINVKNSAGLYSITTEATTDNSSVKVLKAPVISNISIKSNNTDKTRARVGDTVTLTFTTKQIVSKLSNFKINGNNPTTFESIDSGNSWVTTATYVLEESDPEGLVTFQINVNNTAGLYSVTTEAVTDGSLVTVTKSPEILSVGIISNNENFPKRATVNDTVTLTFTTKEEVSKLGTFKINGGNPVSFSSTLKEGVYTNVATYVVDESDVEGAVTFQINVKNVGGFYSITTEATTDNSSVSIFFD